MALFWSTIFPAMLAGGLAGQLATLFGGAWLTQKRDHRKWLVTERYRLFAELLSISTEIPKSENDRNQWTYEIRNFSQKLHVLYKDGTAPQSLADAIEGVFQLARERKDGEMRDDWSDAQRRAVRTMRQEMSKSLTVD